MDDVCTSQSRPRDWTAIRSENHRQPPLFSLGRVIVAAYILGLIIAIMATVLPDRWENPPPKPTILRSDEASTISR